MGNTAGKSLPYRPLTDSDGGGAAQVSLRHSGGAGWTVLQGCGTGVGAPAAGSGAAAPPDRHTLVTIFSFDKKAAGAGGARSALAANAAKRLRSLRHPHILRCVREWAGKRGARAAAAAAPSAAHHLARAATPAASPWRSRAAGSSTLWTARTASCW